MPTSTLKEKQALVTKRKADRLKCLDFVFEATGGQQGSTVSFRDIQAHLDLSEGDTYAICDFLVGQYLLTTMGIGNYNITSHGVDFYERAIAEPDYPVTSDFVEANVVFIAGDVSGGQIQIGTRDSIQAESVYLGPEETKHLVVLVEELTKRFDEIPFDSAESRAEAEADLTTLTAQAKSPRPKAGVVAGAVGVVRLVTSNNAMWDGVKTAWEHLAPYLPHLSG